MKDNLKDFLPLSSATFYILLALSDEDRHGYGIMLAIILRSILMLVVACLFLADVQPAAKPPRFEDFPAP